MNPGRAFLDTASQLAGIGELTDAISAPLVKSDHNVGRDGEAFLYDPTHSYVSGDCIMPVGLSRPTLRAIARAPLPAMIIGTRLKQIEPYLSPSDNRFLPGFQIRGRDRRRNPSAAERRQAQALVDWTLQCGVVDDPRMHTTTEPFSVVAKKLLRDSLTFDLATAEICPARRRVAGREVPGRVQAIDAGTMFIHPNAADDPRGMDADDYRRPRYRQIVSGMHMADFAATNMMWGQRNPTAEIDRRGYGLPELETMAQVFTAYALAWKRNARYFTHGFTGAGFVSLETKDGEPVGKLGMMEFRDDVRAQLQGVEGHHRVAVVTGPKVNWVQIGNQAQDEQWSEWMHTQIKDMCAAFGMDAIELGWQFGNAGQSQSLGGTDPINRARESKARGLYPLIHALAAWWNRWVIWQIDPDFEMVPTGTETRSEDEQLKIDGDRRWFMTGNEVRVEHNLPERADADFFMVSEGLQTAAMAKDAAGGDDTPAEPLDIGSLFDEESDAPDGSAASDAGAGRPEVQNMRMSRRITIIDL